MRWKDFPATNPPNSGESEGIDLYPTYLSSAGRKTFSGDCKLVEKDAGVNGPVSRAILLNGSSELRHHRNLNQAYRAILKSGFYKENVRVISSHKPTPEDEFECLDADIYTLADALLSLKEVSSNEDRLFFYYTGHGSVRQSYDGSITDYAFCFGNNTVSCCGLGDYIRNINLKWGLLVFNQCYSGGFAKELGKDNLVAVSASRDNEMAYGSIFSDAFFDRWQKAHVDSHKDRHLSLSELYDYTFLSVVYTMEDLEYIHDKSLSQRPWIYSEMDTSKLYVI